MDGVTEDDRSSVSFPKLRTTDLGLALLQKGEAEAAPAEVKKEPEEVFRLIALSIVYPALGRHADSDAALAEC